MITKKVEYVNDEGFAFKFEPIDSTLKITETKEGYEACYVIQDESPDDPRSWYNIGIMFCFHKRYNLGDDHYEKSDQFCSWDEMETYLYEEKKAIIVMPLYLYDHGGISLRTYSHGQYASWDGGQVGFIYTTADQIKKGWGIKRISKQLKERVRKVLLAEVETYDQYIQGDVYVLVKEIYDKQKEPIDYDTLHGFFGIDGAVEALETEI